MEARVLETPLPGLLVVEGRVFRDPRGFFTETWNRRDLAGLGIDVAFVQDNHSRSSRGVIRGLHYQGPPEPQGKLVRCSLGRIFDVAVDIRAGSPTFGQWFGEELSDENLRQLWIPPGFAHGFAVMSDIADVQYKCTTYWNAAAEGGIAWNDPAVGVEWPVDEPIISGRDAAAPTLDEHARNPVFRFVPDGPAIADGRKEAS